MSWTRGPLRTPGLDSMELCPLVSLDNVPLIRLSSDLPEFHDFTIQSKRIGGTGDVEMKERLLIGLNNAAFISILLYITTTGDRPRTCSIV